MRKSSFFVVVGLVMGTFGVSADNVRLVVSTDVPVVVNSLGVLSPSLVAFTKEKKCVTSLESSVEFCYSSPKVNSNTVIKNAEGTKAPLIKVIYSTVEFDSNGVGVDEIIETLQGTGWYGTVEADVVVRSSSVGVPNDTNYEFQTYLRSVESLITQSSASVGHDFEGAWELMPNDATKVDVMVLDSEFKGSSDEMPFFNGYSFVTIFGQVPGADYYPASEVDCLGTHGLGVASVIGATTGNSFAIAGAATDYVNITAARVMDCGVGVLSDVANAVRYAAMLPMDETVYPGLPVRSKPFDVINLSLSGQSPCPSFMQSAISEARLAGVSVVLAAGNNGLDAKDYAPGNCLGSLTVGAVSPVGDRASYSNFGSTVKITAQGSEVLGLAGIDGAVGWWEGTSFSAPLVSSAMSLAKSAGPSVSLELIEKLVTLSSASFNESAVDCAVYGCGKGVLDAKSLINAVLKAENGEMSIIKHALASKTLCQQKWYVDHFGQSLRLCSMFEVDFLGGVSSEDNTFVLYRAPKGQGFDLVGEELLRTQAGTVLLEDIDSSVYDYSFKVCEDVDGVEVCESSWYPLDASKADVTLSPAVCD
jgi:serine protease